MGGSGAYPAHSFHFFSHFFFSHYFKLSARFLATPLEIIWIINFIIILGQIMKMISLNENIEKSKPNFEI